MQKKRRKELIPVKTIEPKAGRQNTSQKEFPLAKSDTYINRADCETPYLFYN
jgi:hypothetical protein